MILNMILLQHYTKLCYLSMNEVKCVVMMMIML